MLQNAFLHQTQKLKSPQIFFETKTIMQGIKIWEKIQFFFVSSNVCNNNNGLCLGSEGNNGDVGFDEKTKTFVWILELMTFLFIYFSLLFPKFSFSLSFSLFFCLLNWIGFNSWFYGFRFWLLKVMINHTQLKVWDIMLKVKGVFLCLILDCEIFGTNFSVFFNPYIC